jgi:hypothetical protein
LCLFARSKSMAAAANSGVFFVATFRAGQPQICQWRPGTGWGVGKQIWCTSGILKMKIFGCWSNGECGMAVESPKIGDFLDKFHSSPASDPPTAGCVFPSKRRPGDHWPVSDSGWSPWGPLDGFTLIPWLIGLPNTKLRLFYLVVPCYPNSWITHMDLRNEPEKWETREHTQLWGWLG